MFLYLYSLKQKHTSNDTDELIKRSISDLNGSVLFNFPEKTEILRTDKGKPYIKDCSVNIGVTHTDNIVIIGLSENEFGIDAEPKERAIKKQGLVIDRFFSERERAYVGSDNKNDEWTLRFLEIWVKKEAYFKCFGDCRGGLGAIDTFDHNYIRVDIKGYIVYIYSKEEGKTLKIKDMRN